MGCWNGRLKFIVWIPALLIMTTLPVLAQDNIKVLVDGEIVLGDRGDWIRMYEYNENRQELFEKYNFQRDYERADQISVCDVNGDGVDEIVIGDASSDKVHVYDKDGNELTNRNVGFENEDDLACGDVDKDGKDEIVVGDSNRDRALIVQVEDDWSTWTAGIDMPHGFWGGDRIAVGDVVDENGSVGKDGKEEIIAADTDDNKIHIYEYLGGGGDNRGREITSFDVRFKVNGQDTVQYDTEDEITCGDVNGDGIDEIIYGNGYDTHKIYVYTADGNILFEFNAYFDNSDELAAGDVNRDGLDEIITGDAKDDKIHVYDFNGREFASIDVDYETADGLAFGDVDGDSLVIQEVGCHRAQIADQIVAVINAPPRHIGVNWEGDPLCPDSFSVEYKNEQEQKTSHTIETVQDVLFSAELQSEFTMPFVKQKIKAGLERSWKWTYYKAETITEKVAEGLTTQYRDVVIAATVYMDVCEFKVIKPADLAVINGEQQYITITKPINIILTSKELNSESDYSDMGIPQIHEVGNILTYPDRKEDLVNYMSQNEILSRGFTVGSAENTYYYSREFTTAEERKFETDLKAYLESVTEAGIKGESITAKLRGEYGNQKVTTARLETTEQTDFRIKYTGHTGFVDEGQNDPDAQKMYDVVFVLYTDSEDGHLVLDWIVPAHGRYYATEYLGGPVAGWKREGITGAGISAGTHGGILGDFNIVTTENPYLYIEDAEMPNGSEVQIPIKIMNANDIGNMDIEVEFNSSVLRCTEAISGFLTQDSLFESNVEETVRIAFVNTEGITGNGTIANLRCEVIGKAGDESELRLSASGNTVDGSVIDFEIGSGIFRVESVEEMRGDCNGDGVITSADALIALKMAVGKVEVNLIADMNNDNKVTSFDAASILDESTSTSVYKAENIMKGYHSGIKRHRITDYGIGVG